MSADSAGSGSPVLVFPEGASQELERVSLIPGSKGEFNESWLQRLIHKHPACLPIGEIDPGLDPFFSICREMPILTHGFVDNLLMTSSGDIAIVETKLFRNPQARREVLGQALDYAIALFGMGYEAFAAAALGGAFDPKPRPGSLYEALPEAGKPEEPVFVDAVSRNLRAGRALIVIAGDGIRSEAEGLRAGLPTYARFGFMLALVELNVFRMPEPNRFLVRPRTLAKTAIVQRTVIEISEGSAVTTEKRPITPETLSTKSYWQTLEERTPGAQKALEKLIADAESIGVYPEFLGSLNLKLPRPGAKPLNLGYVQKSGAVWTDAASWFAPLELAHNYVVELASAFECDVHPMVGGGTTSVYTAHAWTLYKDGKPLRLKTVLDRLELWLGPMQRFIAAVQKHDMEQQLA